MVTILIGIIVFILGASIGSFLSVVIHRLYQKQRGIFFGRSRCPHCKEHLQPRDLIPMFSYILSKGKCRYCKKELTPHYVFLEFITGIVFLLMYIKFPFIIENLTVSSYQIDLKTLLFFCFYAIYGAFFIGIFFYDLQHLEIPDVFLFPLMALTLAGSLLAGNSIVNLLIACGIALVFFGGQIALSKGTWLGEGDLYLSFSIAFLLGWELFLIFIVLTYSIGALVSLILIITKKVGRKSQIAFGPFMVIGTFMTLFFGEQILNWYLNLLSF